VPPPRPPPPPLPAPPLLPAVAAAPPPPPRPASPPPPPPTAAVEAGLAAASAPLSLDLPPAAAAWRAARRAPLAPRVRYLPAVDVNVRDEESMGLGFEDEDDGGGTEAAFTVGLAPPADEGGPGRSGGRGLGGLFSLLRGKGGGDSDDDASAPLPPPPPPDLKDRVAGMLERERE